MSEENKQKARRYLQEAFTEGNLSAVDELFTSEYVLHDPTLPEGIRGPRASRGSSRCTEAPTPTPT